MPNRTTIAVALCIAASIHSSCAWNVGPNNGASTAHDRRAFFQKAISAAALTTPAFLMQPQTANALSTPTSSELERLRKGHARVKYLLQEWDKETQVCGKLIMSDTERKQIVRTDGGGGVGCEKTPLKVQDFMGYKSTEDPLFKADKLMVRAATLVDPDDFEAYLEVVEKYKDKADSTAMMAYTSSWGEANPNGGKDVMEDYLEQTRADVVASELYLRQILEFLNLEQLPASKKP